MTASGAGGREEEKRSGEVQRWYLFSNLPASSPLHFYSSGDSGSGSSAAAFFLRPFLVLNESSSPSPE